MERCRVFRRLTLLCLLKASLLYLIDDVEAAASSAFLSLPKNEETAQLASFSSSLGSKTEDVAAPALMEADREERLSFFTVPPMYKKKKRRRTQIQRQHEVALSSTERTNSTAAAVKTSSAMKDTITEKMDVEYAFENGTDISTAGNKTVSSGDKLDPPIEVEDNFCPSNPLGRAVVQSTLPALILLLNIGVHLVAFVLLLYWWKTVYYEVGDPYATISPYGYAPATTPLPQRRHWPKGANDDPVLAQIVCTDEDNHDVRLWNSYAILAIAWILVPHMPLTFMLTRNPKLSGALQTEGVDT